MVFFIRNPVHLITKMCPKQVFWGFFACFLGGVFLPLHNFSGLLLHLELQQIVMLDMNDHVSQFNHIFFVNIGWKSLLSLFIIHKTFKFFREWDCIPVFNIMKSELFMARRAI